MRGTLATAVAVLLATPAAFAWEPAAWHGLATAEPPRDVALAEWAGRGVVLAVSDDALTAWDAITGESLGEAPIGGVGLAVRDLDGDGASELLVCGPAGVSLVRPTLPLPSKPVVLWSGRCDAIAGFDTGHGWPALAVVSEGTVARLDPGDAGLRATPIGPGTAVAASGGRLAILVGGALRAIDGPASTELAPAGVLAVAGSPAGFSWLVGGAEPALIAETGPAIPLAADPRALAAAGGERVVAHGDPAEFGFAVDGVEIPSKAGSAVSHVALADVDGDGCPELALASADYGLVAVAKGRCEAPALPAMASPAVIPAVAPAPGVAAPAIAVQRDLGPTYQQSLPPFMRSIRCELQAGAAVGFWSSSADTAADGTELAATPRPVATSSVAFGVMCTGMQTAWKWTLGLSSIPSMSFGTGYDRAPAAAIDLGAAWTVDGLSLGPLLQVGEPGWLAVGGRAGAGKLKSRYGRPFGLEARVLGAPGETAGIYGEVAATYGLGRYRPRRIAFD